MIQTRLQNHARHLAWAVAIGRTIIWLGFLIFWMVRAGDLVATPGPGGLSLNVVVTFLVAIGINLWFQFILGIGIREKYQDYIMFYQIWSVVLLSLYCGLIPIFSVYAASIQPVLTTLFWIPVSLPVIYAIPPVITLVHLLASYPVHLYANVLRNEKEYDITLQYSL